MNIVLPSIFIKDQNSKKCIQEEDLLKYIKEQTPEICLAAIQKNGCALKFVSMI